MAAMFVLNMSPIDAFIGFANSLDKSLTMMMILKRDDPTVTSYYTSFLKVLNTKFPTLYRHFQSIQLPPSAYLEPMLATRFTQHLRIDVINRVWDIMIFEGDGFLLRVALGIISTLEHRLYGSTAEILKELGWNAPTVETGYDDVFIKKVRDALKAN
jgi:TBC1 domain family member 14